MTEDIWIIISATVMILCLGVVFLFLRLYIKSNDRKALYLAIFSLGPAVNNLSIVWMLMTTSVPCSPPSHLRLVGTIGLLVCVTIGSFGVFFANGHNQA